MMKPITVIILLQNNLSELNSWRWLRAKKEAIINNDNSFQNALDDVLNYQTIKTNPEKISKLKLYIDKYNLNEIIRQLLLIYYI